MNFTDGEKNLQNLSRREKMRELQAAMKYIYKIGELLGFDNIMEKAKWKEVIMGYVLGDAVFSKSTGEVKGADAINEKTRAIVTISPNNPSGAIHPREDLTRVNQICREQGIYHITD